MQVCPSEPKLALALPRQAALTPPAAAPRCKDPAVSGLRVKLTEACRLKVAESFKEELLARVVTAWSADAT